MSWYKHPNWITAGISVLALAGAQAVQVILFFIIGAAARQGTGNFSVTAGLVTLVPAVLGLIAGGAFLGRLRGEGRYSLWALTAVVAGVLPVAMQIISYPKSAAWLADWSIWLSVLGSALLWFAGAWLGAMTQRMKPDGDVDKALIRWGGGTVAVIVLLMGLSWGSVAFSPSYRMAKKVQLIVPSDVTEIDRSYTELGVAKSRQFTMVIPAGDTRIQDFYLTAMERDKWTNISELYQEFEPDQWQLRSETWNEETVEFQLSGGHWQDMTGKVVVSMVLQAEKSNPESAWEDTDWKVMGIILSRPYAEPREPIEKPESDAEIEVTP